MWIVKPMQMADEDGNPIGRWRLTARSDEVGGPHADVSHDHATADECEPCEDCDRYTSAMTGFPSRAQMKADKEAHDRREYDRLRAKFGSVPNLQAKHEGT